MGTQRYAADGGFYGGFNVDSLAPRVPADMHTHTHRCGVFFLTPSAS